MMFDDTLISIHAPTRGATTALSDFQTLCKDFNPRSHERSDPCRLLFSHASNISIHAPTRGATRASHFLPFGSLFQSTLPREERRMMLVNILLCNSISIHAPTRGATIQNDDASVLCLFQSTLPREERPMPFTFFTRCKYFNPRSHERSDLIKFT